MIIHIDPRIPERLVGDPLVLDQMLVNYANNAKFTSSGEIAIQAQLQVQTLTRTCCCVSRCETRASG